MPQESSSPATILSRIRELLGLTPDDADAEFSMPSLEAVLRHTRRQLLDGARYLGLTDIHQLTKDALATQFLQALQRLALLAGAKAQEPADRPHKFDLGRPTEAMAEAERIPWGYGQDRVTTMVVDPDRLYVYWEVTDEAIERARAGLGPGGRDAWLNLRVYDVTNRIFDGTNAHGYLDQSVSRTDRQWFFFLGKPTSTAIVELGLKSQEGYFVRIARSGRADFPRAEPVSPGGVEWLTVQARTGEVGEPAADGRTPAVAPTAGGLTAHVEPVRVWDIRRTHAGADGEWILRDESFGTGWESVFDWAGAHNLEWEGPLIRTSWDAGPFPYPVEPSPYIEERFGGTVSVRSLDGRTHIVYGPWHVVIRGLGARAERKLLAVWETYRSWVAHAGAATQLTTLRGHTPGGSEQIALGASELRWRAASELRLGGASEVYRLGASELRYLGASETLYSGASEWRLQGASERRFLGASQWLSGGASELRYAGASERLYAGASERRHLGGSERHAGGASESVRGYPADRETTSAESAPPKR
jgi:hypothetical protein